MSVRIDKRVLQGMIRETSGDIDDFLDMEAEIMVTNIKASFGTSPPGRIYNRGTRYHVASQPKYPPNVDTGFLRSQIRWTVQGVHVRWIQADDEKSEWLEYGTEKMAPRPFMVPEVMRAYTRLERDLKLAGIFD